MLNCYIRHVKYFEGVRPDYEALSYEWGRGDRLRKVMIDEKPFSIRENLWLAMSHLQHDSENRVFWIDAICLYFDRNRTEYLEGFHFVS